MLFFATHSYLLSVTYLSHSKACVIQIPGAKTQTKMWLPSTIVCYTKKRFGLKVLSKGHSKAVFVLIDND